MATATQLPTATLTMEEYLHTLYKPDCEYVDGHLEDKCMPTTSHGEMQAILASWFHTRRREWNIRIMGDVRTRVSDTRMRLPDVAVVARTPAREYPALNNPPILIIELLRPEDRLSRLLVRLEDFRKMGVGNIWVIDPEERIALVYSENGLRPTEDMNLRAIDSPIHLDLAVIFADLDETVDVPAGEA